MSQPLVTIMGRIGTGKTVQARAVARELGWETFSTGDLIRQGDNPEAKQAHDQGKLAPTEFVQQMIMDKIKAIGSDKGIILDGSPRMQAEANYYDRELPKIGRQLDLVILLQLDDETIHQRLSSRQRVDDTPEGIANRMQQFSDEIAPVIEQYRQRGLVREVNDNAVIPEVTRSILKVLHDENLA